MVNYEFTNGTIVETYVDGDSQSKSNVILDFDFSTTNSEHELVSFGIDPNDGYDDEFLAKMSGYLNYLQMTHQNQCINIY